MFLCHIIVTTVLSLILYFCLTACSAKADVVLVLDVSRYNSREDVRAIKRFARDIVNRMTFRQGNFRVGVVEFGDTAHTRLTFAEGDNKKTIKSVIGNIRFVVL